MQKINPKNEDLFSKWGKLALKEEMHTIYKHEIDLEELIVQTTLVAHEDEMCFQVLTTWVRDFGDLINKRRLLKILKNSDSAILKLVLEIGGEHQDYTAIINKCNSLSKEVCNKFYALGFLKNAFRDREWLLKSNKSLAIRAVFGANIRSEILSLLNGTEIGIRQLSRRLGYAYSGVYREIDILEKNGLLIERHGNGRIISLSPKMNKILNEV